MILLDNHRLQSLLFLLSAFTLAAAEAALSVLFSLDVINPVMSLRFKNFMDWLSEHWITSWFVGDNSLRAVRRSAALST